MGKRTNIGIYIGPTDKDIAAWFNLLERNHMSRARWVRGLLAAYALEKPLRIGVVDKRAPLIRTGDKTGDTVEPTGHFSYGWHVRGPNREFVIGSVVSISIRNDEIKPVLEESWENGHKLATFIKALIRQNLKTGDRDIQPKMDELNQIWSAYLVSNNSTKTQKKKSMELEKPAAKPAPEPESVDDWVTGPVEEPTKKPEPLRREPQERRQPERALSFKDAEPEQPAPAPTSGMGLGRNPLLDQI